MTNWKYFGICFLFLLMFLRANCNVAIGVEWKFLTNTDDSRILYEADSITEISSSVIRVWTQFVPKDERVRNEEIQKMQKAGMLTKDYDSTLMLYEIDCARKKYRIILMADYDKSGKELNKIETESAEWEGIDPKSAIYALALSYLPLDEADTGPSSHAKMNASASKENKAGRNPKQEGPISARDNQAEKGMLDAIYSKCQSLVGQFKADIGGYILPSIIIVILVGIILGITDRAVFYLDKKDLLISFLPTLLTSA